MGIATSSVAFCVINEIEKFSQLLGGLRYVGQLKITQVAAIRVVAMALHRYDDRARADSASTNPRLPMTTGLYVNYDASSELSKWG